MVTYDFLKNVDLIEKHALLFFIHMTLSEYLYGSLRCRFPVYAHANFTKGTWTKENARLTFCSSVAQRSTYPFRGSFQFCNNLSAFPVSYRRNPMLLPMLKRAKIQRNKMKSHTTFNHECARTERCKLKILNFYLDDFSD